QKILYVMKKPSICHSKEEVAMRKWLVAFLILALAGLAAPRADAFKGTLRLAVHGQPKTWDPGKTPGFMGTMLWPWTYDTLVQADLKTGKLYGWLAEKFERVSASAFKFTLRKGAVFADGNPVTSADVKFSIHRVWEDKDLKSTVKSYYKDIKEVEIIDDRTFIIHTKGPMNDLPALMRTWGHVINRKAVTGLTYAQIATGSYGSGAYILKEWKKGLRFVMEANPRWWNNKKYPNRPKKLIIRIIREPTTRVKALTTGEVDFAMRVAPQFIDKINATPGLKILTTPSIRIYYVGYLTEHGGPMANVKVRQAISHAINTPLIIKSLLQGRADPWFQLIHQGMASGYNPKMKSWYPYNVAKAKKLLKESGFGKGFKLVMLSPRHTIPADVQMCEAIVDMVKKIGIDAQCKASSKRVWRGRFKKYKKGTLKGNMMFIASYGNQGGIPGNSFRGVMACRGKWSPHCFPEYEKMIDKALRTADTALQQKRLEKATWFMHDNATHKPIAKSHDVYGVNTKVLDYKMRYDEMTLPWSFVMK
ncbi:MAG: ABC transporter substrate-binding protein, partial [Nitrospinota bacterium]